MDEPIRKGPEPFYSLSRTAGEFVFLADLDDRDGFNATYADFFENRTSMQWVQERAVPECCDLSRVIRVVSGAFGEYAPWS